MPARVRSRISAAIDPKPFEQFSRSVQEIRTGADLVLGADYKLARERMLRRMKEDLRTALKQVTIEQAQDADGSIDVYRWTLGEEPLAMAVRRYRRAVNEFNGVLATYAARLASLAGPDVLSEEDVANMASRLTANANEAAGSLHLQVDREKLALSPTGGEGRERGLPVPQRRPVCTATGRAAGLPHPSAVASPAR